MTDTATKPLVVREWGPDTKGYMVCPDDLIAEHNALVYSFRALRQLADDHFAAICRLDTELRSRPTREDYESDQADLIKIATVAQSLRAQLAASEAERERLTEALKVYARMGAPTANEALAGKDPTDGQG